MSYLFALFLEFDSIAITRGCSEEGLQCRRLLSELLLQLTYQQQQNNRQIPEASSLPRGEEGGGIGVGRSCIDLSSSEDGEEEAGSYEKSEGPDNSSSSGRVIVVAATNRLQDLDEAVIRRFDTKVGLFLLFIYYWLRG
jgi:SpoVK/Ycf46/Vps4 family AAA+-type ATPase